MIFPYKRFGGTWSGMQISLLRPHPGPACRIWDNGFPKMSSGSLESFKRPALRNLRIMSSTTSWHSLVSQGLEAKFGKSHDASLRSNVCGCSPPELNSSEIFGLLISKGWRNMRRNFGDFLSQIFVVQFPGNMATRNFTLIPPHMRTSHSTGPEPKFFH